MATPEHLNAISTDLLPGFLGIVVTRVGEGEIDAEIELQPKHMAPNGFLHAASIIALADSACGHGCMSNLPEGANSFTTVELKSNHLGTARDGTIRCHAKVQHAGRTTQVWDAEVFHEQTGKTLALFRCTQMILYPR